MSRFSLPAIAILAVFSLCGMRCGGSLNTPVSSSASDSGDGNEGGGGDVTDEEVSVASNTGALSWLTQLGTTTHAPSNPASANQGNDQCKAMATDASGNVYCAGSTNGNLSEVNGGNYDAFVMKLNSSGAIQWVTQLGAATHAPSNPADVNEGTDGCAGVAVDAAGYVYCAGYTDGSVSEGNLSYDAFVMKLNPSGGIEWVTQLGAVTHAPSNPANANQGADACSGVAVDAAGNVYCAGYTWGNVSEVNGGSSDAFVMKLNSSGAIQWVTQLGAATHAASNPASVNQGNDACNDVAADSSGNVYCAGSTNGNLSEVNGGGYDAFVMKLSTSGAIQWVTQLGAATHAPSNPASANQADDLCYGAAVDSSGNVYCAGTTYGNLAEGLGGFSDTFVMKLDSAGDILWATQLGATTRSASPPLSANQGQDYCNRVTVDGDGGVYCAGLASGNLGEVSSGSDSFALKLNSSGVLQWLTQLGSVTKAASNPASANQGYEESTGIAVDSNGKVYVGGYTNGNVGESNAGQIDIVIYQLE